MPTPSIDELVSNAQRACSDSGVRLTKKRQNVLLILLRSKTPLSAYDITEHYQQQFKEAIPAMSVYRMLDFLLEEKLAHKLETSNQFLACSHIACDHAHELPQFLICDQCHNVREIGVGSELVRQLKQSVERTGFQLASRQMELHGTCGDCQKSR